MREMRYQTERKVELLDHSTYKGYDFYVVNLGTHPTAYVRVPKGHKYYMKDYNDIDIDVHGGLTYSSEHLMVTNIEGWFIGWDYAHAGDYIGYDKELQFAINVDKKWTTAEIIADCVNVIEQLMEANNGQRRIRKFNIDVKGIRFAKK